ncbi:MAG TPA: membrane protein insertase YidC [Rhizomicrobium sp.]|jgi:YidC/Oxa1 family membrane protein insertase
MMENRNLLLAIVLSALVLLGWEYFVAQPQMQAERARHAFVHKESAQTAVRRPEPKSAPQTQQIGPGQLSRGQALAQSGPRVRIDTPTLDGSLRLTGARFDDLRLKRYHEKVNPKSPEITLLSPVHTRYPYYAVFGFVGAPRAHLAVPGEDTPWKLVAGSTLSPGHPVTLSWDNGQGLVFTRRIAVDDSYMFTVADSVANHSGRGVRLFPYGYVARDGVPDTKHYWLLHEGFVGAANGALKDATYDDFKKDKPPVTFQSTGGWVGITDKYWMAAAIPPQNQTFDGSYRATPLANTKAYQADYRLTGRTIAPGSTLDVTQRLFAGAKIVSVIRHYEDSFGIERFDLAIDWGWFIFLTKPIFWLLDFFYGFIGNFGVAIILLTITIKLLFFPLADTSYRSMSRMKKLQPEIERLRERFADDKMRQQQEMMALYKREKVNPVSGCLPMLVQIPVFFSLYKVLYVTIEMRHAPFFGWIHDLSAADPTCFLNLYGLLPFAIPAFVPAFLHIGIWPTLMGISQWFQTKLNPAPADPIQARMFTFMPLIFTFMLATFPAGLVIYWTCNNLLSTTQQFVMMKRQGVEVHFFKNLKVPAFLKRLGTPGARAEAGE